MQLECWYRREELDTSSQELWDFIHELYIRQDPQFKRLVQIMFLPCRTYVHGKELDSMRKWASVLIQHENGNRKTVTVYTFTYRRKRDGGFVYQLMEFSEQKAVASRH